MLYYVLGFPPTLWSQGSLPSLPAHSPCPLSIPGSLEFPGASGSPQLTPLALSLLPLLPACSPHPLSIPGSLEPPWGLRKPSACYPCSQLAPLTPLASLGPWILPGTSESPQLAHLAPSLLLLLSACSPCSQWVREGRSMLNYVLRSPPPLWEQGARGQAGSKGSKLGAKGSKGEQGEQAGSKGSKLNVILRFRVPTTCGGKNFDDHI